MSAEARAALPLWERLDDELADGVVDPATLRAAFAALRGGADDENENDNEDRGDGASAEPAAGGDES